MSKGTLCNNTISRMVLDFTKCDGIESGLFRYNISNSTLIKERESELYVPVPNLSFCMELFIPWNNMY